MAGLHGPRAARGDDGLKLPAWAPAALLAPLLLAAAPAGAAAFVEERVPLTLDDGRVIEATLRRPAQATGRLPALMLFGGFQRAAQVLDLVHLDRPVIWASFDYPFDPPRKFRFPQSFRHAPEARAAIHGTFDGVARLHAALRARPDVDPARITVIGASAGAPFATVAAARNGIPGVILVQGFADVTRVVQHLFVRKLKPKYGRWIEWPALWLAQWLNWYCEIPDVAAAARTLRAGQQVLLVTASDDDYVPREATEALWSALQGSGARHERMDLPGAHLGVGDDRARIADILARAVQWMERRGLL